MRFLSYILIGILFGNAHGQGDNPQFVSSGSSTDLQLTNKLKIPDNSPHIERAVDSIITNGIKKEAFPGAQVLVAWQGDVIFHKAYGYHTYDSLQQVGLNDRYDLASVTKITAALPALMKLYEDGLIDLDAPFSKYWKPWRHRKDKKDLSLREILAHQAGLTPYIVFLNEVMRNGELKKRFVSKAPSGKFSLRAYDDLYVNQRFQRKMYRMINRSKVSMEKKYRYSGLAFLLFPKVIEDLSGQSYEYYLKKHFYLPMEALTLDFNPELNNFQNPIVPTERDTIYRKELTQGWVHDENASLMGGVSGNAGLFGTAKDLAKMIMMYQNNGHYAGQQYLKTETLAEFTSVQYPGNDNRRGLGFDKPYFDNQNLPFEEAYPAPEVSPESFGHSGFTGTFVWADPKNQLVFIFLSNRVYPYRSHRQLYELNIRPALQQVFYNALLQE